jgi:hypothetical protein
VELIGKKVEKVEFFLVVMELSGKKVEFDGKVEKSGKKWKESGK